MITKNVKLNFGDENDLNAWLALEAANDNEPLDTETLLVELEEAANDNEEIEGHQELGVHVSIQRYSDQDATAAMPRAETEDPQELNFEDQRRCGRGFLSE